MYVCVLLYPSLCVNNTCAIMYVHLSNVITLCYVFAFRVLQTVLCEDVLA